MNQEKPTPGMSGPDPDAPAFVDVFNVRGEKQTVPAHYMTNPVLSRGLSATPPAQTGEAPHSAPMAPSGQPGQGADPDLPSRAWNRDRLVEAASAAGLVVLESATKAEILTELAAAGHPINQA